MQKGAKPGESKRPKVRKQIQIKQSKKISPVKEVQPDEGKLTSRTQRQGKIQIPNIKKCEFELTLDQIEQLSSRADGLVSFDLMMLIIKKQEESLQQILNGCPSFIKRIFQKTIKHIQSSFNTIREQRIQMMKQNSVIFVQPDQDHFEKHKGKVLNNWIKEYIQVHQQKQHFDVVEEKYLGIFQNVEERIGKLAIDVAKDKVEPIFEELAMKVDEKNKNLISDRLNEMKGELIGIIEVTDQMRKIREEVMIEREKETRQRQLEFDNSVLQRTPTHSMALLSIEDYFI